jgi:anti-sigma factor RsiW
MTCLSLDRLRRLLDRELSPEEAAEVEAHLKDCPRCRARVEGCLAFDQAASSLPDLELPAGFADGVMTRIVRAEAPRKVWLAILAVGLGALGASLGALVLASGQSAAGLLVRLGRGSLQSLQDVLVLVLKFVKLLLVGARILPGLAGTALRGLSRLSGSLPLEVLAVAAVASLILMSSLLVGFRRRLFVQDDIGEDL